MLVIGLTGGIASGKSTVADLFKQLGVQIIDTDVIAHALVLPGSTALNAITEHFGASILLPDGRLDRRQLRQHIFSHPEDKTWLENLLHPAIRQQVLDQLALCKTAYAMIIVPLLTETWQNGQNYPFLDRVCVVDCPEPLRIARLAARDQLTPTEAKNQIQQQATREQRLAIANDIINNDLDEEHLQRQVNTLHQYYLNLSNTN